VGVTRGTVSPVFAGRQGELAVLADAFSAAGGRKPGVVLVGAEAGGGKSRLTAEFTARVADRALVLWGGCVELSAASLAYAPFAAVLRELVRERGAAEVAALLPGPATGELAALLPEFGAPPPGADPAVPRPGGGPGSGHSGRPAGAVAGERRLCSRRREPAVHRGATEPDGTVSADLPWTLRELLLVTVKELPEQAQRLLRTAAVGGPRGQPRPARRGDGAG
jgi:hypothetical protein